MNNAYRGDIDVFETMLKFVLKVPTKHANLKLPGFPHEFDLFVPSSTRASVSYFYTAEEEQRMVRRNFGTDG